jgi:hypothetical protein
VGAKGFEPLVFGSNSTQTANNSGWAYIYDYNRNLSEWSLSQRLISPVGQNSYFGNAVAIDKDSLIVGADGYPFGEITGSAFTYVRNFSDPSLSNWIMENALPSAAGPEGHYGYAVDICSTYSGVGAYGYDDLRGGIFLVCRGPQNVSPTRAPVVAVSVQPTSRPTTNAEKFNGGEFTGGKKERWPWGLLLAIILALLVAAAGTGATIYYCCMCCCGAPPVIAKKKKKEEEDSPYTVHGAGGLMDDDGSVYGPSYRTRGSTGYSSFYSSSDGSESTAPSVVKND